jgi:hypothetical protein
MSDSLSRADLEKRIVENAAAVDLMKQGASWLDDDEFRAFLNSWRTLKRFYSEHTDTVISIEVLREYVDYTRLLRRIISEPESAEEIQVKAKDALEAIEYYIDEIIREGVTNLEN